MKEFHKDDNSKESWEELGDMHVLRKEGRHRLVGRGSQRFQGSKTAQTQSRPRNLFPLPLTQKPQSNQPDFISAPMGEFGLLSVPESDMKNERLEMEAEQFFQGKSSSLSQDLHGINRDPDVFFTDLYHYFCGKGYFVILIKGAVQLITLAFTVVLTTFLIGFLKWDLLLKCHDEHTCMDFAMYVTTEALVHPNMYQFFVLVYFFLCSLFWMYRFFNYVNSFGKLKQIALFYRNDLRISLKDLISIEWNEVVQKLVALQKKGALRVGSAQEINAHEIACRILRKENYLVSMINKDILDLSIPLPFIGYKEQGTFEARTYSFYLTKVLEWSIFFCVLNRMFTNNFSIRKDFKENVASLQRRFLVVGLLHVLLLPFILFFLITAFFLDNAKEWHSESSYLGPREWSPYAKWSFRELNELPHFFERRLNGSYKYANQYIKQFQSPLKQVLARCTRFISGSLAAVLLLLTVIDDSIALHVKFLDHNLLWYIGVFGALFAASNALVSPPEERVYQPEATMLKVAAYTHYFPETWRNQCHMPRVREELKSLFQPKIYLFGQELLSLVFAPLILCFSLPKCAQGIVDFVRDHTVELDDWGAVCDYTTFDFMKYGNTGYGAPIGGFKGDIQATEQGKMEKSFVNFKTNHPDWECGEHGDALMDNIRNFQEVTVANSSHFGLDCIREEDEEGSALNQSPTTPQACASPPSGTDTSQEDGPGHPFALPDQLLPKPALSRHSSGTGGRIFGSNLNGLSFLGSTSLANSAALNNKIARSILRQSFLGPDINISMLKQIVSQEEMQEIVSNSFFWMEQFHACQVQSQSLKRSEDSMLDPFLRADV